MIQIKGHLHFEEPETWDTADRVLSQIKQDATYGTFGQFPDFFEDEDWKMEKHRMVSGEIENEVSNKQYQVNFKLNPDLFDIERGGIQHLIGILAGDLFYAHLSGISTFNFEVGEVKLPEMFKRSINQEFRSGSSNSIPSIKMHFDLQESPLLAYSFKPRIGLKFDKIREITIGVLENGFHLVELDTRNLELSEERIEQLLDLAEEAANLENNHVTRFAPNLSVSSPLAIDLCKRFSEVQDEPVVIKVDGGLDGISTCQEIRKKHSDFTPIITCYPLLKNALSDNVPSEFFVQALALSGADVIYPGGRPYFDSGIRNLDQGEKGRLLNSVKRYRTMTVEEYPMPTIAGGVYAGQLHAYYELLGPSVAYFLGGAVALHKDGPIKGASLCSKVINRAVSLREQNPSQDLPPNLSPDLQNEIEEAYEYPEEDADNFMYHSPEDTIRGVKRLESYFS